MTPFVIQTQKDGNVYDDPVTDLLSFHNVPQIRHKLDDVFAQPKAVCYFELVSPVAYESPRTVAALKLFEMSLDERLNEYTYNAKVIGQGCRL